MFLICMMYTSRSKLFTDTIDISALYRVLNIGTRNIVFDLELPSEMVFIHGNMIIKIMLVSNKYNVPEHISNSPFSRLICVS